MPIDHVLVSGSYNPLLVALSVLVAVLASYTAFEVAGQVRTTRGRLRTLWAAGAAAAAGGAIWSMHFIGMLAFDMGMPISYSIGPTLASLFIAMGFTGTGILITSTDSPSFPRLGAGGFLMASGVVAMHYLGMSGMQMDADIKYDPVLVAASMAIALSSSIAALWLVSQNRSVRFRLAAATAMGAAISGMHYTGMAAATFVPTAMHPVPSQVPLEPNVMAMLTATTTTLILLIALAASHFRNRAYALEASETIHRRLSSIAANFPGVIYRRTLHSNGKISYPYISEGVAALMGAEADHVRKDLSLEDFTSRFVHPQDKGRWKEAVFKSAEKLEPYEIEARIMLPDGSCKWVRSTAKAHKEESGDITWDGVILDITDIKNAQNTLALNEERLRLAVEAASLGTFDWNLVTDELTMSGKSREILGIGEAKKLVYRTFLSRIHPDDSKMVDTSIKESLKMEAENPFNPEFRVLNSREDVRWVAAHGKAVFETGSKKASRFIGTVKDITELKRNEERMSASIKEKEVLIKEIHHRVKNNFQVISSLLGMERKRISDPYSRERLDTVRQRIFTIADLHMQLYQSDNLSELDFGKHLGTIAEKIHEIYRETTAVRVYVSAQPLHCEIDVAVPLGLIANELISNCFKHAFPEKAPGNVEIVLRRIEGTDEVELSVSDNGIGYFPETQKLSIGIGSSLIKGLVSQADASMNVVSGKGGTKTTIKVSWPNR